jgi:putative DNA primase/helicase
MLKRISSFYKDIDSLYSKGVPIADLKALIPEYQVDAEQAAAYIERKDKKNAVGLAVNMGKEALEQIWLNFDTAFMEKYPNMVLSRKGENNAFYEYQEGVYNSIDTATMLDRIDWMMSEMSLLSQRVSRPMVKGTVDRIASTMSRIPGKHFGAEYLKNLKNGLFDVVTRELTEHTPTHFSTSQVPFNYEPDAVCPEFEEFIKTVSNDDTQNATMIQEMFGYCLLPRNPKHKAFLLFGDTARNGKSTTAKILCGLLGNDNVSYLSIPELTGDNSASLSMIEGKQLNFSDEAPTRYIESPRFVSMISEGKITINPKYKIAYHYQPEAKYIITCNDIPRFREAQAMANRFIIIPFDYQIPIENRIENIDDILLAKEGSGILNWALSGAKKMKETGIFTQSVRALELSEENKMIGNPVYAYLKETFDFGEEFDREFSVEDLFGEREYRDVDASGYRSFCLANNVGLTSLSQFRREVARFSRESKFMKQVRVRNSDTGKAGKRVYVGMRYKSDAALVDTEL